jgi:hypothetical protein
MLSDQQIQDNWDTFLKVISSSITGDEGCRWSKLLEFYQEYEQRIAFMPASSKTHFHSAFPGGHVSHTLRVYNTALKLTDLWEEMGATIDFSKDELTFATINHDIGKFGTYDFEFYVDQDSNWHRDRGEVYKNNPLVPFMKDSDRSIYLLQDLGVKMSEAEYLAIKLQAGLYEEANKSYLIAYSPEFKLRSNLPYILHQADAMSARIESTTLGASVSKPVTKKSAPKAPVKKPSSKFLTMLNQ